MVVKKKKKKKKIFNNNNNNNSNNNNNNKCKNKNKTFCSEWLAVISQPCLVHVRRFPSPSRSIHFFAWTTWPGTL